MNSLSACSKARTAASVPGEGGFFGGAGSGLGTSALRLASIAFRDCGFVARFLTTVDFEAAFLREGFLPTATLLLLAGEAVLFVFGTTFFIRLVSFLVAVACLLFFACGSFFTTAAFFAFGAAVILPGRFGFLEGAFFPFVARIFLDADELLLVALVIRLLISILGVENEPAPRLNPAHTPVYGCFISTIYRQVKKIPRRLTDPQST
ncbi:MAG TPA: hypothetical protein VNO24_18755 [Blastocatellia bacterium]|nr:hypothetical protein [Blastocatellia bacterium]